MPISDSPYDRIKASVASTEAAKKDTLSGEIATRGVSLDSYLDILGILPDPDPILRKLSDAGGTILNDLMADDHVTSVVQTRKVGTLGREWKIEPAGHAGADPDEVSKRAAMAFADDLDNLNMRDVISQILDAPYYGFVPIEIIYKPDGGLWHIGELRALPASWFRFAATDNSPRFLCQENMIDGISLPENKFVFATHFPTYENPYGLRLLSRCFWPVTFKKGGIKFWVRFLEKFGIPHVIGKYKDGTDKGKQQEILANLARMVQDAVAVVPEGTAVETLEAGSKAAGSDGSFNTLVTAMEAAISKVIEGQTLTTSVGDTGSYAAGKVHENVLESYRDCDAALVKDVIEQIAWIYCQENFRGAATPRFVWHEEDDPKKDFADRDKTLHDAGVRFRKPYFVRVYGFREDEFDLAPESTPATTPPAGGSFAEGDDELDADQRLLEDLMADVIPEGVDAAGETIRQIMDAVNSASDYGDLQERLARLFPKLDGGRFRQVLERALFAAEMFGAHTADVDAANAKTGK